MSRTRPGPRPKATRPGHFVDAARERQTIMRKMREYMDRNPPDPGDLPAFYEWLKKRNRRPAKPI